MSRRPVISILHALIAAAALCAAGAGFAGAQSIEGMLDTALQPSTTPALLGPITESGRTGWACKPEQAAAAKSAAGADLPSTDTR
jgi:hypothetical protein